MKQLFYVNGKRVDINTYANAVGAEITAEEEREKHEIKVRGFIQYLKNNPSVLEKWDNSLLSTESIIRMLFIEWCNSDDCKTIMQKYETQKKEKRGDFSY